MTFAPDPESVCFKEKVVKKLQLSRPCWRSFADLASMLFSLNFVKIMGNFCKVFAVFKQVRDFMAFLYQIAGILLLLSTTIKFLVSLKRFRSYRSWNPSGVIKWNMLNFMSIVYIYIDPVTFTPSNFVPEFLGIRTMWKWDQGRYLCTERPYGWLFTIGAIVVKRKYLTCPSGKSNPGSWIYRQTLYR